MSKNRKVCIFSSSSQEIDSHFFEKAGEISFLFAKKGFSLVFGGGNAGLMGETARVFKNNYQKVISVIPDKLVQEHDVYPHYDEIHETRTMNERKKIMTDISDCFIALAGGLGTLEELLELITLKQLGYHKKPIAILNTEHFYDNLIKQLELIYQKKFADEKCRDLYFISESPGEIYDYISRHLPA